jgi:hypothetical protein
MIGFRFAVPDRVLCERRVGFFLAENFFLPFVDFFTVVLLRSIVLAGW